MDPAEFTFRIPSLDEVGAIFDASWAALREHRPGLFLSRQTEVDVKTAFHEAVVNAVRHARELEQRPSVGGRFFLNHKCIGFEVEDHGPGFSLEAVPVPDLSDPKAGGRGVFMMKQVGDELRYLQGKERNVLRFKRFLVGQNASAREIELLYQLSEAVIRGAGLDEVCQMILDQALGIFRVERASILIYDEKIKRLKVVASRGLSGEVLEKTRMRSGEGVSGYVFRHGRPLLIEDIDDNRRGIEKKNGYKSRSFISAPMICSPLRLGERPLGVINLTDRADGRKFTKKDLKVLSTIANQAMACLYIRDLMAEARKTETLKRELETVRQIQHSYLPGAAPEVAGFDIAGACEMAQSVGGDYYDYFLSDGFLYLVVADVSGHDMNSAMTMFNFRSQLKVLVAERKTPGEILGRLNATMRDDLLRSGHFVSALVMRLDAGTGDYTLAGAGHYPPLFLDGGFGRLDAGLVLGVEKGETYAETSGKLVPGSGFLLFTDGLIEAMNAKGQFYGMERLKRKIVELAASPSRKIVSGLVNDVLAYRSPASVLDDVTAVAVKYDGI